MALTLMTILIVYIGHRKEIWCELDPTTLILKLELDVVKRYQHTKTEVLCQATQMLQPEDSHTDTQTI